MKTVFLFILWISSGICYSQIYTPPTSDKVGDKYFEGIKDYSNVRTGKLKLKSFKQLGDIDEGNNFKLHFYIPEYLDKKELEIYIEDNKGKNYYMIPVQRVWTKGDHIFEWDKSKLAAKHNVSSGNLVGYIRSKEDIRKIQLVPFRVNMESNNFIYQWIFVANQNSDLIYSILNHNKKTVAGPEKIINQTKGEDIIITWDPGNNIQDEYILVIKYIFTTNSGTITRGQNSYNFSYTLTK